MYDFILESRRSVLNESTFSLTTTQMPRQFNFGVATQTSTDHSGTTAENQALNCTRQGPKISDAVNSEKPEGAPIRLVKASIERRRPFEPSANNVQKIEMFFLNLIQIIFILCF